MAEENQVPIRSNRFRTTRFPGVTGGIRDPVTGNIQPIAPGTSNPNPAFGSPPEEEEQARRPTTLRSTPIQSPEFFSGGGDSRDTALGEFGPEGTFNPDAPNAKGTLGQALGNLTALGPTGIIEGLVGAFDQAGAFSNLGVIGKPAIDTSSVVTSGFSIAPDAPGSRSLGGSAGDLGAPDADPEAGDTSAGSDSSGSAESDAGAGNDPGGGEEGSPFNRGGLVTRDRLTSHIPQGLAHGGMVTGAHRTSHIPQGADFEHGGPVTPESLVGPNPPGPDDGFASLDQGEFVLQQEAASDIGQELLTVLNTSPEARQAVVEVLRGFVSSAQPPAAPQGPGQGATPPPSPLRTQPFRG